jgi:four helix bundle protein
MLMGWRESYTKSSDRELGESSHGAVVRDFCELKVWQKAHELTLAVYKITAAFPREEKYGLTSQLRRSCASIAANLSEWCGRDGAAGLARFCSIAMGSASELEYHLLLAGDLKLLQSEDHEELARCATEAKRMLATFS